VAQVVQHLPNKYKALITNHQKKKEEEEGRKRTNEE
jgi:hypothetical protein